MNEALIIFLHYVLVLTAERLTNQSGAGEW